MTISTAGGLGGPLGGAPSTAARACWLGPILIRRTFPEAREVEIDGVKYSSVRQAQLALRCSAWKVYDMLRSGK